VGAIFQRTRLVVSDCQKALRIAANIAKLPDLLRPAG
jgi:hypothetical protein